MSAGEGALDGRALIITGAGTGLGRAVALQAAARGARMLLVGRRLSLLEETAGLCADRAIIRALDVRADAAPERLIRTARDQFGRIDGIVNNAALARFGRLASLSDADLDEMYNVNLRAPLRLIRAALPDLQHSRGAVVNVSSIGGVVSTPGRVAYGALKAALNHATRSLARELAPEVRVCAVLPGPLATPMWDDLGLPAEGAAALHAEILRTTPAGRFGDPAEVAPWVCDLLSDRGAWLSGTLLTVDGGRSA